MGTHCPVSHASPGPTEVGASAGGQGAARCGRRVGSGRRGERGGGGPGRAVGLVRSLALALPLGSLTARASARLLGRRGPPAEWGRVEESRASCTGRGQPMRPGPRPGGSESGLARPGRRGRFRGCRQAGVGPAGQQDPAEGRAHGRATGARAGGQTRRHPESAKGKSHSGHVTPGHGGGAVRGSRWETVAELSAGACAAPRGPSRAASSGRGCPDPGPVTGNWSLSCRDRGPCSRGAPQSALTVTVAFPEVWPREASVPHPARLLEVGLPSSCPPPSCPRLQLCPVGHCGFLN